MEISGTLAAILWVLGGAPTRYREATGVFGHDVLFLNGGKICQYIIVVKKTASVKKRNLSGRPVEHILSPKCSRAMLLYMSVVRPHIVPNSGASESYLFPNSHPQIKYSSKSGEIG